MSTKGNNALIVITDQLTKWIKAIARRDDFSREAQAKAYYNHGYKDMGLLDKIIYDRDPKFTLAYQRELYSIINTRLTFIIVYYAQADR